MNSPERVGDGRASGIWAGIAGPVLFVSVMVTEGLLRSGYDSTTMYVSALSLGPRGWVQILNFVTFGILLAIFARGIATAMPARVGPALLAIVALGNLIVGLFVMDPAGTPRNLITFHGRVHHIVSRIVLVLMPVSCFAFVGQFRLNPNRQFLQWFTIAAGITVVIGVALLAIGTMVVSERDTFAPWLGLLERIVIVAYLMWLFVFALKLRSQTSP